MADTNNGGTIKVRLVKGLRGSQAKHRLSVKALGLNKLNDVRELKDSPQVRGLINKVHYLVRGEDSDMRMNTLSPADGARQERKRVGRGIGSGLGKTAGRGHKGSFARSGKGKIKAGFEGGQMPMHMRLPKIGFRSKLKNDTAQVMLYQLDKLEGDIDFAALRAAKLVPAKAKQAKIVKKGEVSKKLVLKGLLATAGARAAIIAAGGKFEE